MKIIVYCQHVLGVGHFFRTLEIVKALNAHDIVLVTGGAALPCPVPAHVRQVNLPGLMMDDHFNGLYSVDPARTVEAVKHERQQILEQLFFDERPDFFLVELYPFGRKAFRFELDPVLSLIRQDKGIQCRVVCSIRDILVEKNDVTAYETRVVNTLNQYFDGVLIHSDPKLIRLDSSFSRMAEVRIPIVYTGFVTPLPDPSAVAGVRKALGITSGQSLVVVSAGGGTVGAPLLKAALLAHRHLVNRDRVKMMVLTGPYMDEEAVDAIHSLAGEGVRVEPFWADFITLLAAADLSISMAGYNTCMNLVAAGVTALVWPFDQNREQRTRAGMLADFADMTMLEQAHLEPKVLAGMIQERLVAGKNKIVQPLDLGGAQAVGKWIEQKERP
ncbi:putative glycosyl transferase family protein [Desulforapulum autotrophicum HRM2]|uniref:Glycosyl transferase family protein n=1 Tax=Desulforapulum autotrophicum (strain ATCC 43914 / DSM 3382 / VKM B-1955 / HRM2) TaxID=177437 RepID=C0QCZ3_DESAH|nr:glycosyltransferase [Desulforapulum autotrophicum]ACN17225.1 putative glycosyl transferase family protein [Desulforapulum autotrophicum HRM2]